MISATAVGRARRLLGISVGQRCLLIAEIDSEAHPPAITQTAEFAFPPEMSLETPQPLGQALDDFLKSRGFTARRAIFGVPAKWLICTRYDMPPTDAKTASNILYLHASEKIARELGEMVFDYAGDSSSTHSSALLLVGLQQRWMQRVMELAEAARIKAAAVVPTAAAVSSVTAVNAADSLILTLQGESAELIVQEHGQIRSLRHVALAGPGASLIAELRRTVATHPSQALTIWNDADNHESIGQSVSQALQMSTLQAKASWLKMSEASLIGGRRGLPAAALARLGSSSDRPCVDFLHTRLKPPKTRRFHATTQWLVTTAAVLVLGIIVGYADIASLQGQISATDTQLQALAPGLLRAKPFVANMRFAKQFMITSPKYLACLRDLTTALPPDGQTYFTDFLLRGDMKGQVVGRSPNQQLVIGLADALSSGGRFAQLNPRLDAHDARANAGAGPGPAGTEVSFTLDFTYVPRS